MKLKQSVSFFDGESTEDNQIMMAMAVMLDYITPPKQENFNPHYNIPTTKDQYILEPWAERTTGDANHMVMGTTLWDWLIDCLGGKPDWAHNGWILGREETRWMPLDQFLVLIRLWDWACTWLEDKIIEADTRMFEVADDHPLFDGKSFKSVYDDEGHGQIWHSHKKNLHILREAHWLMRQQVLLTGEVVKVSSKDPQPIGAS